jgi:hypothetical protein
MIFREKETSNHQIRSPSSFRREVKKIFLLKENEEKKANGWYPEDD